jgi:hypothetical protein
VNLSHRQDRLTPHFITDSSKGTAIPRGLPCPANTPQGLFAIAQTSNSEQPTMKRTDAVQVEASMSPQSVAALELAS